MYEMDVWTWAEIFCQTKATAGVKIIFDGAVKKKNTSELNFASVSRMSRVTYGPIRRFYVGTAIIIFCGILNQIKPWFH